MVKEDREFEALGKKLGAETIVVEADKKIKSDGGGGKNYYDLPDGATQLLDLIEDRNMNGNIKDIFKACYRLGKKDGISEEYDLKKMVLYSVRELGRVTGRKDYIQIAREIVEHHDNTIYKGGEKDA